MSGKKACKTTLQNKSAKQVCLAPLALPSVFRYVPPAVAKTYVVTFRSLSGDRWPSKFIVLADNMRAAINMAWEHGGPDFQASLINQRAGSGNERRSAVGAVKTGVKQSSTE